VGDGRQAAWLNDSSEATDYKETMTRKSGLGRGLDALMPSKESSLPADSIRQIPVEQISANPRQPRTHFDPQDLAELSASIHEHGVIQPLIVKAGENDNEYLLIAGERRLLAARQAGLQTVPVILREAGDKELLELALVENVQRADLSPLEAAEAYQHLADDFGMSHEEISSRVGKSRTAVTNTMRLLKLPEAVRKALADGRVSEGHGRALLALPSPQSQNAALQTVLLHQLNVRQTEELVRKLSGQKPVPAVKAVLSPEVSALEERLRSYLGTKVSLNRRRKGGTLVIHYYSDEELDDLLGKIINEE
jgi:ParB family transcriptional regulator, chromosome partitioning protein